MHLFVHAEADLSPFTLVIGANGSGKTNFLRFLRDVNTFIGKAGGSFRPQDGGHPDKGGMLMPHFNALGEPTRYRIERGQLEAIEYPGNQVSAPFQGELISIFKIDPDKVSTAEAVGNPPNIQPSGAGIINTLDALKTGIREDLFESIESALWDRVAHLAIVGLDGRWSSGRFQGSSEAVLPRLREGFVPILILKEGFFISGGCDT